MIFTSLGLILVAIGFLIAGIAKSSVALLMVSLMLTVASGVVLVLVAGAARRLVEAGAAGAVPVSAPAPAPADGIMYVPVPAATGAVGGAGGNGASTPPLIGYDDMTAEQLVKLVRSGALDEEQLDAIRTYEKARQGRRTVLDAISRASR